MIENAFVLDTFLESLGSFSVRIAKGKKKGVFFFFFINDPAFFSCTNVFNTIVLVHFWLFKTQTAEEATAFDCVKVNIWAFLKIWNHIATIFNVFSCLFLHCSFYE